MRTGVLSMQSLWSSRAVNVGWICLLAKAKSVDYITNWEGDDTDICVPISMKLSLLHWDAEVGLCIYTVYKQIYQIHQHMRREEAPRLISDSLMIEILLEGSIYSVQ